jgi:TPR repeat protein
VEPVPAARPRYYNRVVAVCIGIQTYEHARVGIAADADRDAESMADLFANTFGFEVVKLVGKDATRKRILGEIDKYKAALGDRDALVVFFAGHGQVIDKPSYDRAGYLVPYDADLDLKNDRDPDAWERKAVNMGDLCETTAGAKAQHVLFVVNACCSGFMANRGSGLAGRPDNLQLMSRRSRIVVAATTESQNATGGSGSRFGPFTPALRARLSKGEAVSVTEMFVPLREQVVRDSRGAMLPQLGRFGIDDGEFVFIPKSFTENEVEAARTAIEAEAKKRVANWTKPEHLHDLLDPPNYKGSPRRDDLEKVWQARLARFRTNAGLGDPLALAALAVCYHRGFGVDKPDPVQAVEYAKRALDTKRPEGKFALGVTLLNGQGKDELEALALLKMSAEDGFLLANVVLADQLLAGKPSAADLKRAEELLDKAEAGGVPAAGVRRVALAVRSAGSLTPDVRRTLSARLKPAADAGLAQAQFLVYDLLAGTTAPTAGEKTEAGNRLTQAAEAGHAEAQFRLAAEHYQKDGFTGRLGLPQDFAAARLWATAAADQGSLDAAKLLATLYIQGDGVRADLGTAKGYAGRVQQGRRDKADLDWLVWFTGKELRFGR